MSWRKRKSIYAKIEEYRKRPLIVYVTSKRPGINAHMATDALHSIIEQLDSLPKETECVDFLIASHGGDPMVAWRIITLIRQRVKKLSILIPQSAYSAATLVALGGDEIVMHPNGHLGPVDMQITTTGGNGPRQFSTEDISSYLDFVRDTLRITDQKHITALFEKTCAEVGSLGIGFTARSTRLAVDLGERLLALHMSNDEQGSKLRSIVENMSRRFQSHAYPVSRTEAIDIGLPVANNDRKLETLMWSAWLNLAEELKEHEPFNPLSEILSSPEGKKLLAPVPQLDVPMNISVSGFNSNLDDLKTVSVNPVDFEICNALVESARNASASTIRGKILACRSPDLQIQFNAVIVSDRWEKQLP